MIRGLGKLDQIGLIQHLGAVAKLANVLATLRAVPILEGMLMRGFTTVRDAGGADANLVQAVETGLVRGPRIFQQPTCHHRPEVTQGHLAHVSSEMLKSFFRARRG